MNKNPQIESTKYTLEELIALAGVSYESITNAIDNGEVEIIDNEQIH
ncbi:hypothetical protein [Ammoniphilus sp. 3BR4]